MDERQATASACLAAYRADQQRECSQAWSVGSVPNGSTGSWACSAAAGAAAAKHGYQKQKRLFTTGHPRLSVVRDFEALPTKEGARLAHLYLTISCQA